MLNKVEKEYEKPHGRKRIQKVKREKKEFKMEEDSDSSSSSSSSSGVASDDDDEDKQKMEEEVVPGLKNEGLKEESTVTKLKS